MLVTKTSFDFVLKPQYILKDHEELYKEAILEAVKGGHARLAQSLIEQKNINLSASMQNRILAVAVYYGHEDIVRNALENGADPNSKEHLGSPWPIHHTPLTLAAIKGHANITRLLISQGAEVEWRGNEWEPLCEATKRGYRDITQILLDNGADIDGGGSFRPLKEAAFHGQDGMFFFLVKAGANVSFLKHETCYALPSAALKGYETMIRILISYGVDVKANGKVAVLYAMMGGHGNVVKTLVEFGAEKPHPSVIEENFHKSVRGGCESWVLNLIAQGVDANTVHPELRVTPLSIAKRYGHRELVKALIELGAK